VTSTPEELPRELPGREPDDALGAAALDDVRARIHARVDETQGAWARKPSWRRAAPVVLAAISAIAWAAWCVTRPASDLSVSALAAFIAGAVSLWAVALAPREPGRAERVALAALAVAAGACALEVWTSMGAAPVAGDDVVCARAAVLGGLLPAALAALHVRLARTPARPHHVAVVAAAGLIASMGAVWAECPGTAFGHIATAHLAVPVTAVLLLALAARPLLRGR
jgi:hypothetical protein